eukprot:scaffold6786_cov384-Prasinococcus_capsulatus_cf.AAC.5
MLNEISSMCDAKETQRLVRFYGAFYTPESGQISIALELLDASFGDLVHNAGPIPEPILANLTQQVLEGLEYLHRYAARADRSAISRRLPSAELRRWRRLPAPSARAQREARASRHQAGQLAGE